MTIKSSFESRKMMLLYLFLFFFFSAVATNNQLESILFSFDPPSFALTQSYHHNNFESWLYKKKITNTHDIITSDILLDNKSFIEKKEMPHAHMHTSPAGWKNPNITTSGPPPLMGVQTGVVETVGIPPLGYEKDGNVKVFRLIAQPVEKLIVDSKKSTFEHLIPEENKYPGTHNPHYYKKIKCWGYNGSMPGPTIEAIEGDRIRIIVKNELPEPTSVHWHGLEVPNQMDGAVPETAAPILPGETYTYEFTLHQSGTLMYHSGFNVMKQDHSGLSGVLVIHPKKYEQKIDKQFAIMLQQWSILPGSEYLDLVSMHFNWFTFNGFASPSIPVLTVNQGDRVRIRFANMIMNPHPIHIHGYVWDEVGTEGGPIPKLAQRRGSTIEVPAGTTRDVEFTAWNPGLWRLHCHMLHHIVNAHTDIPMGIMPHGGMFTLVHVLPKDPHAPWQHPNVNKNEEMA